MSAGQDCLICGTFVDGDEAFVQHHINRCLDSLAGPSTSSTSAEKEVGQERPPLREVLPDEEERADDVQVEGCPVCGTEWTPGVDRDVHVGSCLGDDLSTLAPDPDPAMPFGFPTPRSSTGSDDADAYGGVYTPDLLRLFPALLSRSSNSRNGIRSAVLCSPEVVHCRAKVFFGPGSDTGWGCGYRNAQMLLSAARWRPPYKELLLARQERRGGEEVAEVAGIGEMQTVIEHAWRSGFDPPGSAHFGGKLVGKRKWVGTTEIYVLFTSLGLRSVHPLALVPTGMANAVGCRARIVDFPKVPGGKGAHAGLTQWVKNYFDLPPSSPSSSPSQTTRKRSIDDVLLSSNGTPVRQTTKLPIYLQHQGHSRTVVGVEVRADGEVWLLVFDPARSVPIFPPSLPFLTLLWQQRLATPQTRRRRTLLPPSLGRLSRPDRPPPLRRDRPPHIREKTSRRLRRPLSPPTPSEPVPARPGRPRQAAGTLSGQLEVPRPKGRVPGASTPPSLPRLLPSRMEVLMGWRGEGVVCGRGRAGVDDGRATRPPTRPGRRRPMTPPPRLAPLLAPLLASSLARGLTTSRLVSTLSSPLPSSVGPSFRLAKSQA